MSYGIIFTDFSMPVLNGIDATKQIRNFFKTKMNMKKELQPVIIGITGHVQEKFHQEGLDAGMDVVRSKPFFIKHLKELVSQYSFKLR